MRGSTGSLSSASTDEDTFAEVVANKSLRVFDSNCEIELTLRRKTVCNHLVKLGLSVNGGAR